MSNVPGLFVLGEANFSDHGANRLGASALMQGLGDGYFVIPHTVANYLAGILGESALPVTDPAFDAVEAEVSDRVRQLLAIGGTKSPDWFHKELGRIMWDHCGMARNEAGLQKALSEIPALREEFYKDVRVLGSGQSLNQSLEKAGRVADFLELGELMCLDALDRRESCGGHFREESQTEDGEALRNDDDFSFVSAWEWTGEPSTAVRHEEPLVFENVALTQRSYK